MSSGITIAASTNTAPRSSRPRRVRRVNPTGRLKAAHIRPLRTKSPWNFASGSSFRQGIQPKFETRNFSISCALTSKSYTLSSAITLYWLVVPGSICFDRMKYMNEITSRVSASIGKSWRFPFRRDVQCARWRSWSNTVTSSAR